MDPSKSGAFESPTVLQVRQQTDKLFRTAHIMAMVSEIMDKEALEQLK